MNARNIGLEQKFVAFFKWNLKTIHISECFQMLYNAHMRSVEYFHPIVPLFSITLWFGHHRRLQAYWKMLII